MELWARIAPHYPFVRQDSRMSEQVTSPVLSAGVDEAGLLGLAHGYHQRPTRLLKTTELGGQLAKVYAIEAPGRSVDIGGSEHALHLAALQLAADREMGALGLAFVMLHAGGDGDYVLVHSWVEGYMSRLSVFNGPMDSPASLRPASRGLAPCVWEAHVIAHEREAFVRHVLDADGPLDARTAAWSDDVLTVQAAGGTR